MAEALATKKVEAPSAVTKAKSESLLDRIQQTFGSISRRAFEIFESNGRIFGRDLDDWFRAERELPARAIASGLVSRARTSSR